MSRVKTDTKKGTAGIALKSMQTLLFALVIGSAIAVVYAKHQSRKLFVELQELQKVQDRLDTDWGRLQLEQSAWATHGRVERIARKKLGMHIPKPDSVIIVRP